jgi:dipeptidyl aminopeptidase/acylaminoacyl peptidase
MRDTTLVAQPFDASRLQLSGEPVSIAAGVYSLISPVLGMPFVSVSRDRTIVYRTGAISDLARQLTWYSRDGTSLGAVGDRARYGQMKISPDGSRLAASQTEIKTGNNADIWITDLATQTRTRLTFGPGADAQPTWSPDGQVIAWVSIREGVVGIYRKPANGAGADDLLYQFPTGTSGGVILSDWSSDGFLVFAAGGDVFALPIGPDSDSTRQPIPVVQTPAREFGPDLSPDSRWLVYISDETGRQELFVQPFAPQARAGAAPAAGKWMVSSSGTLGLARWRGDSRELFFTAGDGSLMAVDVTADARAFQAGAPRRLFQLPRPFVVQTPNPGTLADIRFDGQRLLLALPSEESTRGELSVIMNWQPPG